MKNNPQQPVDRQKPASNSSSHVNVGMPRLVLFLLIFLNWLCISFYTAGLLEIRFTELVLKPESCALVRHLGINARPLDTSGACSTKVRFRQHLTGGTLYIGDQEIRLADDQLIAVTPSTADESWTGQQIAWAAGWGISTALLMIILALPLARRSAQ